MKTIKEIKSFILLWLTQSISQLGSTMTSLALGIWLYESSGSALKAALLSVCSYTPYVLISIFAGALSDKWNKKVTMLVCDSFAVLSSVIMFVLFKNNLLEAWHMYALNIVEGLMNTFQGPASEIAMSILTPKKHLQRCSGLKSLSRSLITIFAPLLATSIYSLFGLDIVFYIDFASFIIATIVLALFIRINEEGISQTNEDMLSLIKGGFVYLKENRLILDIILFMSGINLAASCFDGIITPLVLLKTNNNETILGLVTSFSGVAMLVGSFIATIMKEPKDKVKTIFYTIFFSMLFENFLVAFSDSPTVWCFAQVLGWAPIPIFSSSYDVLFKTTIPLDKQGRVYSFRNSLQFFTIPLGTFVGGLLVDILEPIMINRTNILSNIFGSNLGSGASLAMFIVGVYGVLHCIIFKQKLLNKK